MVPNPAIDLWRAVRQREMPGAGSTQVRGVESGVLIEISGEEFSNFRRQQLIVYSGIFIAASAGLILLFYLVRGSIRIDGGRSGKRIKRFAEFDRVVHWLTATLFIFLGLTGLTLLFGRFVILPVLGPEAFSVVASLSKEGHNLFGPLFLVAVVLLFVRFAVKNMPNRGDITWLVRGGGIIGKGHVSAGYFNAGEKIWFWLAVTLGLVMSVSGLILVFPILGLGRELMQLALIVHGITSAIFIAGSFGHIYIGTLGTEGSIESMTTGYVDENWAKAHHDLWYQDVKNGVTTPADEAEPDAATDPTLRASPDKA
jgi:formate dehydrogenase subunit gamma